MGRRSGTRRRPAAGQAARRRPCRGPIPPALTAPCRPQALLASAVGADYVAPYLGRMGDAVGADKVCVRPRTHVRTCAPLSLAPLLLPCSASACLRRAPPPNREPHAAQALAEVASMAAALAAAPPPRGDTRTRLLVASIRGAGQMAALAAGGCDTFTFGPGVMKEMLGVPATLRAVADFEAAAARNGGGAR